MRVRGTAGLLSASVLLFLLLPSAGPGPAWLGPADRLEDAAFWRLFSDFSEPSGYFQSDNLVSNETTFPDILSEVESRASETSGYVGVGPEQNFSYLAALKPRIAFIVDIRRQNAVLHLLYKALFEAAPDRADFLSRLLSRERPLRLDSRSSVGDLLTGFAAVPPSAERFEAGLKDIRERLMKTHGFSLTDEDLSGLKYVYSAFFQEGPGLQYSFGSSRQSRPFPTFAELMTATDERGNSRSFLASEENYQAVREMQQRNLIVPIVGDFGGGKALKAVAAYLSGRGLKARVFYTSNVESYLFRSEAWKGFYDNLAVFPVDRRSILIRSVFGGSRSFSPGPPATFRRGSLQVDGIEELVATVRRGEISSYGELVARGSR